MNLFLKLICAVFIVIIVGLFIECYYNKKHALMSFVVPKTILVIKPKELDEPHCIVVYNSKTTTLDEAMEKVPKSKRHSYHEQQIHSHLSKKVTEPFSNSYEELKNNYAENMPVSFMYKTALGIVDIAHNITSPDQSDSTYRMLVHNDVKHVAFVDGNNIFLK